MTLYDYYTIKRISDVLLQDLIFININITYISKIYMFLRPFLLKLDKTIKEFNKKTDKISSNYKVLER